VQALRRPLLVAATAAIVLALVLMVFDLRGPPRGLWITPAGLSIALSGMARRKSVEWVLGSSVAAIGVIVAALYAAG
jgi:hypothetical protein